MAASPVKRFRLQSQNLFLTFAQCDYPLDNFLANCKDLFKDEGIERMVVARELHQDGHPHLHAVISLKNKFNTRDERMFDDLVEPAKHPNIVSRLHSIHKTYEYVIKDGHYLFYPDDFDVKMFIELGNKKKSTKMESVARMIKAGKSLEEVDEAYPEVVIANYRKIVEYEALQVAFQRKARRLEDLEMKIDCSVDPEHPSAASRALADWLSRSIRQPIQRRHKQMWFKSGAGAGKTETIRRLEEYYNLSIYRLPLDEDWFDEYEDGMYDLILLDEYKNHKKIQTLNKILSNDLCSLSRRGKPPYLKRDVLPVLILSNFTPAGGYSKACDSQHKSHASYLALLDRLTVHCLPEDFKLRLDFHDV